MNWENMLKGAAAGGVLATLPQATLTDNRTTLPIHFVGFGGAGCSGAAAIHQEQPDAFFTCITSPGSKAVITTAPFIPYPFPETPAVPPKNFQHRPPVLTEEMQHLFSLPHHFVLLAGLGGYTGTGLLQAAIRRLQENGAAFTAIASLPFRWETGRRKTAEDILPVLQLLPRFYSFDLSELSAREGYGTMRLNTFMQRADEQFYQLYRQAFE